MNPRRHPTFVIGFGLVALLVVQDMYGLKIPALEQAQRGGTWKVVTGALLVAFLGYQWVLAALRVRGSKSAGRSLKWHRCVGAFGPVFFYAHASKFGYAPTTKVISPLRSVKLAGPTMNPSWCSSLLWT